nr:hypothetical protein [Tanacetum cinerariifolium]
MVDDRVKELTKTQVPIYVANGLLMERKQKQADMAKMIANAIQQERDNLSLCISTMLSLTIFLLRFSAIRPRDQDDHHDDAYLEGENSAKRQKTFEHETYVMGESSSD